MTRHLIALAASMVIPGITLVVLTVFTIRLWRYLGRK